MEISRGIATLGVVARIKLKLHEDKHFAELIKGSGIAFVLKIAGTISGYVFTLLITRTLGAEAWGIFALSLVVLQMASVIGRLGMDTALLRFTAEYTAKGEINTLKEIYKKVLNLAVLFSILVAISVCFLSPVLADKIFHKPYLTGYFRVISFIISPFVLLCINSESIRGLRKIKEYMLLQQTGISVIAVILFLIGLVFIKSRFLPIVSYGISILILATISIYLWRKYLICFLKTFKTSSQSTISKTSKTSYKSILSVSIPMLLSSSLVLIMGWVDTIMLGVFRSTKEVGIYNIALKLSMVTSLCLMAVNTIVAPKFAEFWRKKDLENLKKIAQYSTKLIFCSSYPILVLYCIFPQWFMGLFGKEFKFGFLALIFLSVGQFVNAATGSVGQLLLMTGKQNILLTLQVFVFIGNIFLNYLLIPNYGIVGASIATSTMRALGNLIAVWIVYKLYKFFMWSWR